MRDAKTTRELQAIQRKLDRWELEHLREHSAELAERLEAALARIEDLERELSWADGSADMFQGFNSELMDQMDISTGISMGITKAGSLGLMDGARA